MHAAAAGAIDVRARLVQSGRRSARRGRTHGLVLGFEEVWDHDAVLAAMA